ncbi:hypothetical protein [Nafulsella turpanensis]|uniref:hypothetical protein n=1 Tax=Nafulsella turpanensis TaxID=1265690 RepID=UPI00034DFCF8|nr:hypothetical protein [Nafulsella turpanensis]
MLKGKGKKTTSPATKESKKKVVGKAAKVTDTKGEVKVAKKKTGTKDPEKKEVEKPKNRKPTAAGPEKGKIKEKEKVPDKEEVRDLADQRPGENRPSLRAVYSNKKQTLLPLGFATDFSTKTPVVIFSDLTTGNVYTVSLAIWKRWKLKEVKKINTET